MNKIRINPFDYLVKELRGGIRHKEEFLGQGTCNDHSEYMFVVGQIKSLRQIEEFISDLIKEGDEND